MNSKKFVVCVFLGLLIGSTTVLFAQPIQEQYDKYKNKLVSIVAKNLLAENDTAKAALIPLDGEMTIEILAAKFNNVGNDTSYSFFFKKVKEYFAKSKSITPENYSETIIVDAKFIEGLAKSTFDKKDKKRKNTLKGINSEIDELSRTTTYKTDQVEKKDPKDTNPEPPRTVSFNDLNTFLAILVVIPLVSIISIIILVVLKNTSLRKEIRVLRDNYKDMKKQSPPASPNNNNSEADNNKYKKQYEELRNELNVIRSEFENLKKNHESVNTFASTPSSEEPDMVEVFYSESPEQGGFFLVKNLKKNKDARSIYSLTKDKKKQSWNYTFLFDNERAHEYAISSERISLAPACDYDNEPIPKGQIKKVNKEVGLLEEFGPDKLKIVKKIKIRFQ